MIRAAQPLDAGKIGSIMSEVVDKTSWMPRLYSRAQDIAFCGVMIERGWVHVVENTEILGFIARRDDIIHALYVRNSHHRKGVGRMLLDHAKTQSMRLKLWVFQANDTARKFYAHAGFYEVARGNGHDNDENLPDIYLEWKRERR